MNALLLHKKQTKTPARAGVFLLAFDGRYVGELHVLEGAGVPTDLAVAERDDACSKGEKSVVRPHFHVFARTDLRTALADDDASNLGEFSRVELGSEALAMGIASVRCRTAGLFMCHR